MPWYICKIYMIGESFFLPDMYTGRVKNLQCSKQSSKTRCSMITGGSNADNRLKYLLFGFFTNIFTAFRCSLTNVAQNYLQSGNMWVWQNGWNRGGRISPPQYNLYNCLRIRFILSQCCQSRPDDCCGNIRS